MTTGLNHIKLSIIWVEKQLTFLRCQYEHLTSEDLGHKPSAFEKAKFEYFLLGMSLSKALKKDEAKSVVKSKSDFNYDSNYICFEFSKSFDEFEEMPLGFSIR